MFIVPLILYSGMRRADTVREGRNSISLTPQLLTGQLGGLI